MATIVNDLVTKFSFEGTTAPITGYNDALTRSLKLLGGMLAGLQAVGAATAYWANGVLTGVDSLDALSRQTGIAVGKMQELNFIAEQSQSSTDAMQSSIRGLHATIGTAAIQGSEDFARLGISVRDASGHVKSADRVLEEVRQRFVSMNLTLREQGHFASALGIDASLIQMLNRTSDEMAGLRDRARELGTLTEEQTAQAAEYRKSMNAMWFSINSVKQLVAVGMAPELANMAKQFTKLLSENKDWIVNGLKATAKWIGNFMAAINRLMPFIAGLAAGFVALKIGAIGFGTVMGTIFSPVVLITGAIVAILAAVDDLIVAFRGGKSVIRDFFQETFGVDIVPILKEAVEVAGYLFDYTMEWIGAIWDFFKGFLTGIGQMFSGDILGGLETVWNAFATLGDKIIEVFRDAFAWIRDAAMDILPQWAVDLIEGDHAYTPTASEVAAGQEQWEQITGGLGGALGVTPEFLMGTQVTQSVTQNIYTSDPEAAGRSAADNLKRQLDNANTQTAPGGR